MGQVADYKPSRVPRSFIFLLSLTHTTAYFIVGTVVNLLDYSIPIWIIPLSTYITEVLALLTHWVGHHRWWMWWHKAHMGHHINDYPPNKFLSEGYQPAKKDNSKAYYLTIALTPVIACYIVNDFTTKMFITTTIPGILLLLLAGITNIAVYRPPQQVY